MPLAYLLNVGSVRAFASVQVDVSGYAQLQAVSAQPPSTGDYLPVTIRWIDNAEVTLSLPFDRYYLDEQRAPQVEQGNRASASPTYAIVRVRKGYAVLEYLVLNGELLQ